jgi:hypothetical protein
MQCIGITKKLKRCKNKCKFLFCKPHFFQFIAIIVSVVTLVSWNILSSYIYDFFQYNKKFFNNDTQSTNETITLKTIQVDIPLFLFTLKDEHGQYYSYVMLYLDSNSLFLVLIDNKNELALNDAVNWSGAFIDQDICGYIDSYYHNQTGISCFLCIPGYRTLYHKIKIIDDESSVRNNMLHLKIEIIGTLDITLHKGSIDVINDAIKFENLKENNYLYDLNDGRYSLAGCPYFIYFNSSYKYRYCLDMVGHESPIVYYHYAGHE